MDHFVRALKVDVQPLYFKDFENTRGTGLCNPSVLFDHDGTLRVNIRHVEYTLYYSQMYQSTGAGPLSYYHGDNDIALRTNNYMGTLDPDTLKLETWEKVDMSVLDVPPKWEFVGLEDARLVRWDDRLFLVGVRRDTTPNGVGRMELSEIVDNKEVSRCRIECPDPTSYCEKNWMPVLDKPYHFVKWTNPVEVVKVDMDSCSSETVYTHPQIPGFALDIRGGSPLVRWDEDTYISICHECEFVLKNNLGHKDGSYYHRFVLWDSDDFSVKMISNRFKFMGMAIEFCIGMDMKDDQVVIAYACEDNASYALKVPKNDLSDIIWTQLQCAYRK